MEFFIFMAGVVCGLAVYWLATLPARIRLMRELDETLRILRQGKRE